MNELDPDTVALFSKRAYDIAGTMQQCSGKSIRVFLNGVMLPIKSFKDYLGHLEGIAAPIVYEKVCLRCRFFKLMNLFV